tara:strand:+ start:809 stop:1459 length:651 start_codon:yes stop_codon:yes gene_type:complete
MTDLTTVLKPLTKSEGSTLDTAIDASVKKTFSIEAAKTANEAMKKLFEKRFDGQIPSNRKWEQYFLNSPSNNLLDSIHVNVFNWGRDIYCERLSPDYAAIRELCDNGEMDSRKTKHTFLWLDKKETYAKNKLTFTERELSKGGWQSLCNTEFNKYGKECITGRRSPKVTKTGKEKFEAKLSSLFNAVNAENFEGNAVECNNLLNRFRALGFTFKSE